MLNLGAYYHLTNENDKKASITESLRVLKPKGVLCLAYINKYANIIKYSNQMTKNFDSLEEYLRNGFNSDTSLFYASSPEEIEILMSSFDLEQLHNVATDGMKFVLRDTINSLSDSDFKRWMKIHLESCETKSLLGYSEHRLYIGLK